MKISALPLQELTNQVEIAVNAVQTIPEIQNVLLEAGIEADSSQVGLALIQQIESWQARLDATTDNATLAQSAYRSAKKSIDALYYKHLEAARYIYRESEERQSVLQLSGPRHTRYAQWFEQGQTFYEHLDPQALEPLNVPAQEVKEAKKLLENLGELWMLSEKTRRQARKTTHSRQMAEHDLRQWFRRFVKAIESTCQDHIQLLESKGMINIST